MSAPFKHTRCFPGQINRIGLVRNTYIPSRDSIRRHRSRRRHRTCTTTRSRWQHCSISTHGNRVGQHQQTRNRGWHDRRCPSITTDSATRHRTRATSLPTFLSTPLQCPVRGATWAAVQQVDPVAHICGHVVVLQEPLIGATPQASSSGDENSVVVLGFKAVERITPIPQCERSRACEHCRRAGSTAKRTTQIYAIIQTHGGKK